MEHSKNFDRIKKWYDDGKYTREQVRECIGKKYGITEEEFYEICGPEPNEG